MDYFHTTRWSVVLRVYGDGEQPDARWQALEELCHAYWQPIYAYLRRSGHPLQDAEDLAQGFFASLLKRGSLETADPQRGKFRSFLLGSLKNHVTDVRRFEGRVKRGGNTTIIPIDAEVAERWLQADGGGHEAFSPELAFDRTWANTLIGGAADQLSAKYQDAGKAELFRAIQPYLLGSTGQPGYVEPARELNMSRGAFAMAVMRLREDYAAALTEAVAETVHDPRDVEEELRYLMSLFSS